MGAGWNLIYNSQNWRYDTHTNGTTMQDSNGNQITIAYKMGVGVTWTNSSARIDYIQDVRFGRYTFTYSVDWIPHLASISNSLGTGESYAFTIATGLAQNSPFPTGNVYGNTSYLQNLTQTTTNLTTRFTYDANGYGELGQVTFPYGGTIGWQYAGYTDFYGRQIRVVQGRTMNMAARGTSAPTYNYTFARQNGVGPNCPGGSNGLTAVLTDVSGNGQKTWCFGANGLQTRFLNQQSSPALTITQDDTTWAQDGAGRPYVSQVQTTQDPGQSYAAVKQASQSMDGSELPEPEDAQLHCIVARVLIGGLPVGQVDQPF